MYNRDNKRFKKLLIWHEVFIPQHAPLSCLAWDEIEIEIKKKMKGREEAAGNI